jgi:hypothetical protein
VAAADGDGLGAADVTLVNKPRFMKVCEKNGRRSKVSLWKGDKTNCFDFYYSHFPNVCSPKCVPWYVSIIVWTHWVDASNAFSLICVLWVAAVSLTLFDEAS